MKAPSSDSQYDLAEGCVGFHTLVGLPDFAQVQFAVDHGMEASAGKERDNLLREGSSNRDLLLKRPRPQHRANHLRTLAQHQSQLDVCLRSCHGADQHNASARGERMQAGTGVSAASEIEDDIESSIRRPAVGLINGWRARHDETGFESEPSCSFQLVGSS